MEHIRDQDCDICFVQETFLKEADTAKLQEIRDYGWDISSNPRKHRSGGGIAFLSRKELMLSSNEKIVKYKSFQVMEAVIQTTTGLIRLVNVYRPPYTKKARYTESTFLEEFEDYICELLAKPGRIEKPAAGHTVDEGVNAGPGYLVNRKPRLLHRNRWVRKVQVVVACVLKVDGPFAPHNRPPCCCPVDRDF